MKSNSIRYLQQFSRKRSRGRMPWRVWRVLERDNLPPAEVPFGTQFHAKSALTGITQQLQNGCTSTSHVVLEHQKGFLMPGDPRCDNAKTRLGEKLHYCCTTCGSVATSFSYISLPKKYVHVANNIYYRLKKTPEDYMHWAWS